jgi:hypothetical protein
MTPIEKAKELFNKYADGFNFDSTYRDYRQQSKQCALIAVEEILQCHIWKFNSIKFYKYWQEVQEEILRI